MFISCVGVRYDCCIRNVVGEYRECAVWSGLISPARQQGCPVPALYGSPRAASIKGRIHTLLPGLRILEVADHKCMFDWTKHQTLNCNGTSLQSVCRAEESRKVMQQCLNQWTRISGNFFEVSQVVMFICLLVKKRIF